MSDTILLNGGLLVISLLMAVAATCLSVKLALAFSVVDEPGEIKIHKQATPRLGGLGIFTSVIGMCLWLVVHEGVWHPGYLAFVCGASVVASVGLVDDVYDISPLQKALGQIFAGLVFIGLMLMGLGPIEFGTVLVGLLVIGVPFLLFMSNALNLLDGMDGLAAGSSAVAAGGFAAIAWLSGDHALVSLSVVLLGACLGFLVLNRHPAATFMGDVGSLFLGYALGAIALLLLFSGEIGLAPVMGVLLVLGLPIADTALSILRRLVWRRSLSGGDRLHLYDCLSTRVGGRIWPTVLAMWLISLVLAVLGVYVYFAEVVQGAIITGIVAFGLTWFSFRLGSLGFSKSQAQASEEGKGSVSCG